ncbi:pancreatic lipase-related protein 2-like [Centruroides sculpturatus]|uniref:pancreatic lipase-related protein 2-like n=1 Tax=Centruroides sculpturatus TaxID=218467 RepID=UPI000C6DB7C9|nr:pancreatic lipase-related protein 2-like [Centruroides sculpturatus]
MNISRILFCLLIVKWSYSGGTLGFRVTIFIGNRVHCLRNLGCFRMGPPFAQPRSPISYLPNSREFIRTKFLLYTRRDPWFNEILIPDQIETIESSKFNSELPTKVIVHGCLDSTLLTTWMKRLTLQLFSVGDYNVIIVDWFIGSTFASYAQVVANARVVGAEIAFLIKRLQLVKGAKLKDFHLICHSLGAHVCGYAGKRLSNLGRITCLDPAGPYFRNVSRKVRLDASDAMFVDIIHTNAAESIFKAYPRSVCMDTNMHGFESCGLWPCNRFKIGDEEYIVLDKDANLSESAEVSQNLATERQQEQTDTLTCVAQSNQITEQEQTEEVKDFYS